MEKQKKKAAAAKEEMSAMTIGYKTDCQKEDEIEHPKLSPCLY